MQTATTDRVERTKPALKRTKYACVNCKSAKAACDSSRPCGWCVRHALQDSCVDAPRKTRTSKKICCDPSLHKNVVFKSEYKGFQLALASDFPPASTLPESPMSPPADIFPIEDYLAPGAFDFGISPSTQVCTNCPLYQSCSRDASQRLICATSASPPQSPLTSELDDDIDGSYLTPAAASLSEHPDFYSSSTFIKQASPILPVVSSPHPATPVSASPVQALAPYSPAQPKPMSPTLMLRTSHGCCGGTTVSSPAAICSASASACVQSLPPLLDDSCSCQSLVQREMAKINACLDNITALMQLQQNSTCAQMPTATFRLPDTTLQDCNNEFAKALGFENVSELIASKDVKYFPQSPSPLSPDTYSHPNTPVSISADGTNTDGEKSKVTLASLVPEKNASSLLRYAKDLQRATSPCINQIALSTKRGDVKYFTVLVKPSGWFSSISILKTHSQFVEGFCMCGE